MTYTRTEIYNIHRAMETFGGSFVKKLAELLPLADDENLERLVKTFPEYFEQYKEMTKYLNLR